MTDSAVLLLGETGTGRNSSGPKSTSSGAPRAADGGGERAAIRPLIESELFDANGAHSPACSRGRSDGSSRLIARPSSR